MKKNKTDEITGMLRLTNGIHSLLHRAFVCRR